jgi:hypothetical protein
MKRLINLFFLAILITFGLAACGPEPLPTNKSQQTQLAAQAANSIHFTENAEIENIKHRLELTSKPDLLGYIVLFNSAGQPILYTTVKGKVTSGSKRLTRADETYSNGNGTGIRQSASDEGTYGSSGEYIYFWDANGAYHQWNDKYMYSDQPIRLRVEPIIVDIGKHSKS